jgi:hypothetical protein
MRIKTPETGFTVHLDDRLMFTKGPEPVAPFAEALDRNARFEAYYQLVDNYDKRAFFGNTILWASRDSTRGGVPRWALANGLLRLLAEPTASLVRGGTLG